jgi:hypothetical protein
MSAPTAIRVNPNPWANQSGVPTGTPVRPGCRWILKEDITSYYAWRHTEGKTLICCTSGNLSEILPSIYE